MCILPNLGPHDLPDRKHSKRENKETENVEIIVVDRFLKKKV
jgi:hypothetical protein